MCSRLYFKLIKSLLYPKYFFFTLKSFYGKFGLIWIFILRKWTVETTLQYDNLRFLSIVFTFAFFFNKTLELSFLAPSFALLYQRICLRRLFRNCTNRALFIWMIRTIYLRARLKAEFKIDFERNIPTFKIFEQSLNFTSNRVISLCSVFEFIFNVIYCIHRLLKVSQESWN